MDNNWKRAQDPAQYFGQNPGALKYYLIPKDYLNYEQFPQFLHKRTNEIWKKINQFFGLTDEVRAKGSELKPQPAPTIRKGDPTVSISGWRKECETWLSASEQAHPILKDYSKWIDIFLEMGLTPQWSGRYHSALEKVGIKNVSDFAFALIAFRLKTNGFSSGKQRYQFDNALPGGKKLVIETHNFGGWAWNLALQAMQKRGFDWKKYLVL